MTRSEPGEGRTRGCPSLLIVEDDSELARGLESYFTHAGYQVEVVRRGDRALDIIRSAEPDIILLDWRLPRKTGAEVLREAREQGVDTPAIMTSVHPEGEVRRRDGAPGADDYIPKPFDLEDLKERMSVLLE